MGAGPSEATTVLVQDQRSRDCEVRLRGRLVSGWRRWCRSARAPSTVQLGGPARARGQGPFDGGRRYGEPRADVQAVL